MKNSLSDIYDQVLLREAEKHNLQNPSADEVGSLKVKQDLFGTKPKPVEGPDKAKLKQGPSYQQTTGTSSAPKTTNTSIPKSAPAKGASVEKGKEMKDTEVDPTEEKEETSEKEDKKQQLKKENFTMNAFETLFKKTIMSEQVEEMAPDVASPTEDVSSDLETEEAPEEFEDEASEEEMEEEEGDLISDLRELQDKLNSILDKLEDIQSEESEHESEEYSDEDFDNEFAEEGEEEGEEEGGEEESPTFKESIDKPKPFNNSKGKGLMNKKNKVGKLTAKGGKAHAGSMKSQPSPKALGDKKKSLQKGNQVKSSIKKGEFIK